MKSIPLKQVLKMKKQTYKVLILASVIASFSMLQADGMNKKGKGMGRPAPPVFSEFDANGDGVMTEKEFFAARDKRIGERAKEGRQMKGLANMATYSNLDANSDGGVTENEFNAFLANHMKKGH